MALQFSPIPFLLSFLGSLFRYDVDRRLFHVYIRCTLSQANLTCPWIQPPTMLTQPTPLPSNPFGSDPFSQPYLAYKKCHDLESLAHTDQSLQKCSPPGLVAARLLGHLLVYSENGRETLAGDITDAPDNATLLSMAQHYIIYFVNICMFWATLIQWIRR